MSREDDMGAETFDITIRVRVKRDNILKAETEADFLSSNLKDDMPDCGIIDVFWDSISPVSDPHKVIYIRRNHEQQL